MRGVLRVLGIETEFQDAVLAPHLLVVPVVIAVVEFGEIGMVLDNRASGPVTIRSGFGARICCSTPGLVPNRV
jgi:hypothetical protein